jgi:hypothetical protein
VQAFVNIVEGTGCGSDCQAEIDASGDCSDATTAAACTSTTLPACSDSPVRPVTPALAPTSSFGEAPEEADVFGATPSEAPGSVVIGGRDTSDRDGGSGSSGSIGDSDDSAPSSRLRSVGRSVWGGTLRLCLAMFAETCCSWPTAVRAALRLHQLSCSVTIGRCLCCLDHQRIVAVCSAHVTSVSIYMPCFARVQVGIYAYIQVLKMHVCSRNISTCRCHAS